MQIIKQIKAGVHVAPALPIIIYFLFVGLDMATTYLASPDLKYEYNWIVRHFGLNWVQIILYGSCHALLTVFLFLLALNYIHSFYKEGTIIVRNRIAVYLVHNRLLSISLVLVGYFYNNLFYSVYVTLNNYLSHLYINKEENLFSRISDSYINFEIMCGKYFFPITYVISISVAVIYTIFLVRKIERKYLRVSMTKESV